MCTARPISKNSFDPQPQLQSLMIWGTKSSTHGSSRKRKWWATALLRQIGYGHHALTELHGLGRATEARQNSLRHDVVEDSSPSA